MACRVPVRPHSLPANTAQNAGDNKPIVARHCSPWRAPEFALEFSPTSPDRFWMTSGARSRRMRYCELRRFRTMFDSMCWSEGAGQEGGAWVERHLRRWRDATKPDLLAINTPLSPAKGEEDRGETAPVCGGDVGGNQTHGASCVAEREKHGLAGDLALYGVRINEHFVVKPLRRWPGEGWRGGRGRTLGGVPGVPIGNWPRCTHRELGLRGFEDFPGVPIGNLDAVGPVYP